MAYIPTTYGISRRPPGAAGAPPDGVRSSMSAAKTTTSWAMHPAIDRLFRSMSDQAPGNLSVLYVSRGGNARLRYKHPWNRSVTFSLAAPRGSASYLGLVEVRCPKQPPILVTSLASAVFAVALR